MSLTAPNPIDRTFYYSETPSIKDFTKPECFYFKILEFDDEKNFLKYVIIGKIMQIDNPNSKIFNIKYVSPFIPLSIVNATKEFSELQKRL